MIVSEYRINSHNMVNTNGGFSTWYIKPLRLIGQICILAWALCWALAENMHHWEGILMNAIWWVVALHLGEINFYIKYSCYWRNVKYMKGYMFKSVWFRSVLPMDIASEKARTQWDWPTKDIFTFYHFLSCNFQSSYYVWDTYKVFCVDNLIFPLPFPLFTFLQTRTLAFLPFFHFSSSDTPNSLLPRDLCPGYSILLGNSATSMNSWWLLLLRFQVKTSPPQRRLP